jgi:hypothetical protein
MLYEILVLAFGVGVLLSARRSRALHIVGALLMVYAIFNFYWPPMHQREVIAAGGSTLTDTLHLVWAGVTVTLMFLFIAFGAAAFGKRFRWYSFATAVVLLTFGILTAPAVAGISTGEPTPWAGVLERINIFMSMPWIAVLALALLLGPAAQPATRVKAPPTPKPA